MGKSIYRTSAGRISSFSTVIGTTLVLTMIGVLIVFLLVGNAVTRHFREQLTVQVMLRENAPEADVLRLQKFLEGREYAGSVTYTSKDEAARIMQKELGEEFVDFLGYNPLPASLDIRINPLFSSLDSLQHYVGEIESNPLVDEVVYQKNLLQQINENLTRWGLGLLVVGALFLLIAVVLIVNTIELAIFSQRFIIRSMQLVGATQWFIQKPFLLRGLRYGFTGAVLALGLISAFLYGFKEELTDVIDILISGGRYLWMVAGVLAAGLVVSGMATLYAVRRFIRLRLDQLH